MLNEKQEKFCQAYVVLRNATEAAKKAGYTEQSAYNQGYRLLQLEEVLKRIEELDQEGSTSINVVKEFEHIFESAKTKGSINNALKALELLSKVKGTSETKNKSVSSTELEKDIISYMEMLGKDKMLELISRCSFMKELEKEEEENENSDVTQEYDHENGNIHLEN